MAYKDEKTGITKRGIKSVSYTHEAMILWMISNPHKSQGDAALYFGVTQGWLSKVVHSDAFQLLYRKRQDEVASVVAAGIPEKLNAATSVALDRLTEKIEGSESQDFLLDATDKLLKANGFAPTGQRNPVSPAAPQNQQNNTFIISGDGLKKARELLQKPPTELPAPVEKVVEHVKES